MNNLFLYCFQYNLRYEALIKKRSYTSLINLNKNEVQISGPTLAGESLSNVNNSYVSKIKKLQYLGQ